MGDTIYKAYNRDRKMKKRNCCARIQK